MSSELGDQTSRALEKKGAKRPKGPTKYGKHCFKNCTKSVKSAHFPYGMKFLGPEGDQSPGFSTFSSAYSGKYYYTSYMSIPGETGIVLSLVFCIYVGIQHFLPDIGSLKPAAHYAIRLRRRRDFLPATF